MYPCVISGKIINAPEIQYLLLLTYLFLTSAMILVAGSMILSSLPVCTDNHKGNGIQSVHVVP